MLSILHQTNFWPNFCTDSISIVLYRYGAQSLIVSRFLHHIVSLYSDPTAPVRDAASSTLVEIYRHVGDRVRVDLQKKHNIPPAKYDMIMIMNEQFLNIFAALGYLTEENRLIF